MPRAQYPANGRITVRTSVSVHKALRQKAEEEGVSVNFLVTQILAAAVFPKKN